MAGELRAGAGVIDITPPIGVSLAGGLRARASSGIDTKLYAKAVVFDNGETALCIISVDLCVLGRGYVDVVTRLIEERTGIPPEHVMVAASHTHAGPYTSPVFGAEADRDREYLATLPRYIADSATIAHQHLVAVQVGSASGREETSSHYRRVKLKAGHVRNTWMKLDPEQVVGPVGEIDPEIGVLLARDMDGNAASVIYNYTLHANCHYNRAWVDGSYPPRVAQIVEGEIGGMVLYTPGACGNINPVGKPDGIARALADEILRVVPKIKTSASATLRAGKENVTLPLRDFSRCRIEAIRRDWPEGEDVFAEEWRMLHEAGDTSVETSVQALAINDTAFVATPGELFVEIGREIKEQSPFERTYVVELANDYVGGTSPRGLRSKRADTRCSMHGRARWDRRRGRLCGIPV